MPMTVATQPAMIKAVGLTRRFGELTAVDHLDLEIGAGEIFGLVGPDGAGKTTTLRLLAGLMDPSEGHAVVAGFDVARQTAAVKDRIGYMAQRFGLYADLTVEENMLFYAELFGALVAHDAHGTVSAAPGRKTFRRHEAEAGLDVHLASPAASAAAR